MTLVEFLTARASDHAATANAYHEKSCQFVWALHTTYVSAERCDCGEPDRRRAHARALHAIINEMHSHLTDPSYQTALWVLLHLAAAYATHPDYRHEWNPA